MRLLGARIGAALICSGGKFESPQGVALGLDNVDVKGDVWLDSGFDATGEVRLRDARIACQLNCSDGRFKNGHRDALILDGAEIGASVFLATKISGHADGFHATGAVRLPRAGIGGQLNCSNGRFDNPDGCALVFHNATVRGGVVLSSLNSEIGRFHATGEVNLQHAQIVGQLNCSGGRFDNSRGPAFAADGADVRDNAELSNGFHATGEVRLLGARISDQLNCSDGTFENSKRTALNLQEARANSLWLRNLRPHTAGVIDLVETDVSLLADDAAALASQDVSLRLDGFVHKRIAPGSPCDATTRLHWLELQRPGYHPQPYDQLARVFSALWSGLRGQGRADRQAPQAQKNAASWVAAWVAPQTSGIAFWIAPCCTAGSHGGHLCLASGSFCLYLYWYSPRRPLASLSASRTWSHLTTRSFTLSMSFCRL